MGRFSGKTCRLLTMLALTVGYFFVEIVVGYATNSMALVADSFHMLSDVLALLIAFFSIRISRRRTKKNTFGWVRAEVLGALVNSVFLVALCFSILVEAIKRLIVLEKIHNVKLLLAVGGIGLVVNLIGMGLFHGHSHGGGHGHSHPESDSHEAKGGIVVSNVEENDRIGSRERLGSFNLSGAKYIEAAAEDYDEESITGNETEPNKIKRPKSKQDELLDAEEIVDEEEKQEYKLDSKYRRVGEEHTDVDANKKVGLENGVLGKDKDPALLKQNAKTTTVSIIAKPDHVHPSRPSAHSHAGSAHHLNMRGVFLHVLGDALGSVVVIISALSIYYFKGDWRFYVDPLMSLLLVMIILATTLPLLRESALILLQTAPSHIRVEEIKHKLIKEIDGVLAVHEFHVWRLAGTQIIATAHIRCKNPGEYMKIAGKVKEFFHKEGIHSTTIQPEFVEAVGEEEKCLLLCNGALDCAPKTCCGKNEARIVNEAFNNGLDDGSSVSILVPRPVMPIAKHCAPPVYNPPRDISIDLDRIFNSPSNIVANNEKLSTTNNHKNHVDKAKNSESGINGHSRNKPPSPDSKV